MDLERKGTRGGSQIILFFTKKLWKSIEELVAVLFGHIIDLMRSGSPGNPVDQSDLKHGGAKTASYVNKCRIEC